MAYSAKATSPQAKEAWAKARAAGDGRWPTRTRPASAPAKLFPRDLRRILLTAMEEARVFVRHSNIVALSGETDAQARTAACYIVATLLESLGAEALATLPATQLAALCLELVSQYAPTRSACVRRVASSNLIAMRRCRPTRSSHWSTRCHARRAHTLSLIHI